MSRALVVAAAAVTAVAAVGLFFGGTVSLGAPVVPLSGEETARLEGRPVDAEHSVLPEGQGRKLVLYSWGDPEEIHDLARIPLFLRQAMPWLRIARNGVYAFGGSMGGQETLLMVARYPELLDGAAAFDAPTSLKARYNALPGSGTQALIRLEVGGTPMQVPQAYAIRSPLDWAKQISFSRVPLQIWWSTRDRIVTNQAQQSGRLYREIKKLNSAAPVMQVVGTWQHSAEMPYVLPKALALFGLMPPFHAHALGLAP